MGKRNPYTNLNLVQKLYENEKVCPNFVLLRQPLNGVWQEYTWTKVMDMARRLVSFFHDEGLKRGDRVSILSKNCAEWYIADFAISMGGLINVPLFPTQHYKIIDHILKEADVKLIFLGKLDAFHLQESVISDNIIRVNFPYDSTIKSHYQWGDIMQNYEPCQDDIIPDSEDIYTIIYTSGSGGLPKGVELTYSNQLAAANTSINLVKDRFQLKKKIKFLSYLPLAHVFERGVEIFSVYFPVEISFAESKESFSKNLKEVSPTIFAAVPRIWKIFREGVLEKIPQSKLNILLRIPVLSAIIKRKIKRALGLQNAICISGSAPLNIATLHWFESIGIVIYEAFGATENIALAASNDIGHRKAGTVGRAAFSFEFKVGENKELLCRSPAVMRGYYLNPDKTREAFDEEGFYHMGDIGEIDDEGYITVHGRLNDTFKTDKGEFVVPAPIENRLYHISQLSQICIIGKSFRQPVLISHLTPEAKKESKLLIQEKIFSALQEINNNLAPWEKISHVLITKDEWSVENELLTPSLKIRRNKISEKYYPLGERLQNKENGVYWEEDF